MVIQWDFMGLFDGLSWDVSWDFMRSNGTSPWNQWVNPWIFIINGWNNKGF
jgi:hypothetical protein